MKTKRKAKSSMAKRSWQKFIKNRMAVIGLIGLAVVIIACLAAPLLTSYDPTRINPAIRELPPSSEHLLGTDRLGRDIFARILYGGRWSIMIGVLASLGANLLGSALGCISGFYGGKVDRVLVAIQELFSIFPGTLLIMLCVGIMGRSVVNLLFIFTITGWAGVMRIVRSRILSLKQEPFVESCRANGISGFSIMFHHLLPNSMGPIIVNSTMNVAGYILSEASLSFLGLGVPDNVPTWGNIINGAKRLDIVQNLPMLWLAPAAAICILVLSVNFFGDGLRDALDSSSK